jgi:hypothetical protein
LLARREEKQISDEAGTDTAEEIFAVGFGLFQDFGLVAALEGYFLQEKFDGILGLETLLDQFADARGEAISIVRGAEAGVMIGTLMIAKFARGQTVEGSLGIGIVEQSGDWGIPFAQGAGPATK